MVGTVQVKPQNGRFGPFLKADAARRLPAAGAPMPALALDLLAQVLLQRTHQVGAALAEALGHLLDVAGAVGGLGQLAQQLHQGRHRLLKLISAAEITGGQNLLDLPVQPKGGPIQQGPILSRPVAAQKFIRILAGGELEHPQLQQSL